MVQPATRFPRGPEDLTPEWLTYALRSSQALSIGKVVSVECALVEHQGNASRVYGLKLTYEGHPAPPPTNLVAKLPPLKTYQSDQELWRGFQSEATFYQNNTRSPLPIPVCYFVDYDPMGQTGFVLLLEDLRPLIPLIHLEDEQAVLAGINGAMTSLALLHSYFWGKREVLSQGRGVEILHSPGTRAFIEYSKPTREAFLARHAGRLPKAMLEFCDALGRESPALARGFEIVPLTLIHFDMNPSQVLAGRPNRPAMLIDWATMRWGAPTSDVPINLGPWSAPHELRWARLYHSELSQQLGRDRVWGWDDFYRFYRASPPTLGMLMYVAAFMGEEQLRQSVQSLPDRPWYPRPTWQEYFLEWPAQWLERHGTLEAYAELEAIGEVSLRVHATAALARAAAGMPSPAAEAAPDSKAPPRTMPPPATSISSIPPPRPSQPAIALVLRRTRELEKRFPDSAEDLNPRWLTDALRSSGALRDGEVVKAEVELVEYQGQASRVYGLKLEYSGCTEPPPARLVAKIPPIVSYQPLADRRKNNVCETVFYRHYGRDPLLPIPTCYFADVDTNPMPGALPNANPGFVLLLEDLRPFTPLEFFADEQEVDAGMVATMKSIAALHSRFWRRDSLEREPWLNTGIYRGHPGMAAWSRDLIERVRAKYGARMSASMQQLCDLLQLESKALFYGFLMFPHTLVHFDVHPRQIMFGASNKATLIDWGSAMFGVPVLDTAFDGGPWAAAREERWLNTYYTALSEHLANDNQSWARDDFDLCVRAHPPRFEITLYALAYMDDAQWARISNGFIDRPWMKRPTLQEYCFDWMTDWIDRHRTLDAYAEIIARGQDLITFPTADRPLS